MGRTTKMPQAKGFTLIELLVVVAIIGVLTSIVLTSLRSSRTDAADKSVMANLSLIRTQAEKYAIDNGNSYGVLPGGLSTPAGATSVCLSQTSGNLFADSNIKAALIAAQNASGGTVRCVSDGNSWQAAVQLKSAPGTSWCVASNGVAKTMPTANVLDPTWNRSCLQ